MTDAALPRKERRRLERIERKKNQRQRQVEVISPLKSPPRLRMPHAILCVFILATVATAVLAAVRPANDAFAAQPTPASDSIVQIFLGTDPKQPEIMQVAKSTAEWHLGKLNEAETEMWVAPTQKFWIPARNAVLKAVDLQSGDQLLRQDGKTVACAGILVRSIVPDAEFADAYHRLHGEDASVPMGAPGMYLSKVKRTFQHDKSELYQIYYGSGKPPLDLSPITLSSKDLSEMSRQVNESGGSMFVTAEHPYYVPNKSKFVQVKDLNVGDQFRDFDGNELAFHGKRLVRSKPGDPFKVYNLEVADHHTYFVGKEGIWVHNDCPWPVEKAISAYRVLLDGPSSGNKWKAFNTSLGMLLKRGDMLNYEQRRLYLYVQDEFRKTGGLTHDCPRIPLSSDPEHSLDEFFRAKGKWVEPNPMEDAPTHLGGKGIEKEVDRVIDGVRTEYYSPETTNAEALSRNVAQKARKTVGKMGDELVVDVTGNPAWSAEVKQRCIERSAGVALNVKLRFRNGSVLE